VASLSVTQLPGARPSYGTHARRWWTNYFQVEVVRSLTAEFDPTKYEDDYRVQVLDLINRKAAGEQFELTAAAGEPPRVVDMMEALEASVAAAKAARQRHPTAHPATPAKKAAAKRPARRKTA
jgi:DNA end-binding protein Ku